MTLGIFDYLIEFFVFLASGLAFLFSPLNPFPIQNVLD